MSSHSQKLCFLFKPTKAITLALFLILLSGGIAVRLIDLHDLPLDYAASRQLHSFLMAREFYYRMDTPHTLSMPQDQRAFGISAGQGEPRLEPPIMEYFSALVYRMFDREIMIVPRLISICFWVIGGIPLFLTAKRLMNLSGAFTAFAIYLFLPFGVVYSRTFQPDSMTIMFILWAWFFQLSWYQDKNWKNAILAGLFTGIALLTKITMVFFVGLPMTVIVLIDGIQSALKNKQVYYMALLSLTPAVLFNLLSATLGNNAESIFENRFFFELYLQPRWYADWIALAKNAVSYHFLILSLFSIALAKKELPRAFLLAIWGAFLIFTFVFAYHVHTHDYYHLPLVPITAFSIGLLFSVSYDAIDTSKPHFFSRIMLVIACILAIAFSIRTSRGMMVGQNYEHEAQYWAELGETIGNNVDVIALTHDYGYRLSYWGGIYSKLWPTGGDIYAKELMGTDPDDYIAFFDNEIKGYDVFLVTLLGDLDRQTELKDYLYQQYPYESGNGYVIFDLQNE